MRFHSSAALCLALFGAAACARTPVVQSDLPIVRVVVYRNGVAYFERSGHVEGANVRFKMKQAEVGDFLATLAVMEQGGSSVRAAAFPLKMDDDNEGAKPDAPKKDADKLLRTVVLSLDGRAHDLQIRYVAAAPVWRPSYRLVVLLGGQADMQAWGIVENLSGEDWSGVQLALVAGAPLAFEAQLGTPIIPDRPIVTDQGEVIAAMPKSETSVEQEAQKKQSPADAPPPPPAPTAAASAAPMGAAAPAAPPAASDYDRRDANGTRAKAENGPAGGLPPGTPAEGWARPSQPRNLRSLAAVAVQGGSTRYDIPNAVTVPDNNATMVMLLSQRVKGESSFLFAPDGGVPDSFSHPFHVVRFENATKGVLERGPIAVFEQGSFVGQGLLDPLPAGATATVPFALERAIGIDSHQDSDVQGARLAKIENGAVWIERDAVIKTSYAIENGGDGPAKILVKHPRIGGSRLFKPPAGTEDNVGAGTALVPVTVAAHDKGKLVVDERSANREWADWFSAVTETAVKAYLADKRSDADVVQKLAALWPLHGQIVGKQDERNKAQAELGQLASEAQEKRADIHAIEKNRAAEALRTKLTARLAAIAARQDVLTAQSIQLQQDLSEMQIRWRDGVRGIKLVDTPAPAQ
jgi:hypothetical protein